MQTPSSQTKRAVARITLHYRRLLSASRRPATLREFAAWLSEALVPHNRRISHQSVKNWSDQRYLPDRYLMLQIARGAQHDRRGDFAQDILAAIEPERYQPATSVGQETRQPLPPTR